MPLAASAVPIAAGCMDRHWTLMTMYVRQALVMQRELFLLSVVMSFWGGLQNCLSMPLMTLRPDFPTPLLPACSPPVTAGGLDTVAAAAVASSCGACCAAQP